ncbi:hypothetical protein [Alteromonas oceanisediminis]|uniref:hypothetical protein n=1 Tax=Alteromonas oceanisediminis TaxID=2836180 RepID=UPI001BD9FB34|nr:hypothetical protein [Alteromonas oceanisediminis]MBT0586784.1 hypothetical protein [Alteromonas oceanisediminis]
MTLGSRIIWLIMIVIIGSVFYSHFFQNTEETVQTPTKVVTFDERLLRCNEVTSAQPTDAFTTCQAAAEEGSFAAQKKIAWAYTQDGEFQDWQAAFDWLQHQAYRDRNLQLLSSIVLFLLGESDEDKLKAERQIRELANIRVASAQAYLATLYYLELNLLPRDANQAWLLENAFEQTQAYVNTFEMVTVYVNGFGTRKNIDKARELLAQYANANFPVTTNNAAWFLATLDRNPLTEPDYAVSLASSVVNDPEHAERYTYIDTLAAAHAAAGDYTQAVAAQEQAITLLAQAELDETRKASLLEEFEQRLTEYQAGEPVILDTVFVEKNAFFEGLKRDIERILLRSLAKAIQPPEGYSPTLPTAGAKPAED